MNYDQFVKNDSIQNTQIEILRKPNLKKFSAG